tara:strand:- start:661 stop:909 length:249 start_codon:yes stop_codon:yes gene_type:complete
MDTYTVYVEQTTGYHYVLDKHGCVWVVGTKMLPDTFPMFNSSGHTRLGQVTEWRWPLVFDGARAQYITAIIKHPTTEPLICR